MSETVKNRQNWQIQGMDCDSCELFVEKAMRQIPGVISAKADKVTGIVSVEFATDSNIEESKQKLIKYLEGSAYSLSENSQKSTTKKSIISVPSFAIAGVFILFFILLQKLHLASIYSPDSLTPVAIVIIGVIASLSSCLAVVGGLALTVASKIPESKKFAGISAFHVGRIVGFVLLGGLLGGIFSRVANSTQNNSLVPAILELSVAIILLFVGLDSLGIRTPTKFTLPKFIGERVINFAESNSILLATLVGAATFFLPCGFTQSMQFQAAISGSFLNGAVIMGLFALGTLPALALMSFSSRVSQKITKSHEWAAAMGMIILFFAVLNLIGAGVKFGILSVWVVNVLY